MDEGQLAHGLPTTDWQPPSAPFRGSPAGAGFQGPPYFNPHAHQYRPRNSQVAGMTHGLPNWDHSQQARPPPPSFEDRGMNSTAHSAQTLYLAHRLDQVEERSEEEQKQRLRLESKVDGNAQTLAHILKELKALKPQAVAVAAVNLVPAGVNPNSEVPAVSAAPIAPIASDLTSSVTRQPLANQPSTTGGSIRPQQKNGRAHNDATDEPNSVAETAARVPKRRVQPNQTSSQGESSKRAKTAHLNPAGAGQSGPDRAASLPSLEARSTAVFRPRPEAQKSPQHPQQEEQQQQEQQQEKGEAAANRAAQPTLPSAPADNNPNNATDLRWAREFLDFIKRMDCRSDAEFLSLKKCVKGRVSFDFPLCTDSPTRRTKICYFLKVGGSLSTTLAPNPDNRPAGQPGAAREEVENLNIYETYLDQRCAAATNNAFRAFHPPKYVVPLGEVYRACRSSDGPGEVASTNFLVFMDVTGPRKSVWMMYRYEKAVEDRDRVQWRPVAIHNERDSVFSSSVRTFDAVCLLEDVREWKGPAEEMIGMGRFGEALPDEQVIVHAAFYTPVLEKMREVLKNGWMPAVDQEE
ncbi:hypothetical protein F5144DRAFT_163365 [Chaetomium tenue]|uniref:Uncharacterized protein n=1 Tax=Chaetomium tenue TaxID=1854479 RepID=A0ACB7PAC2_9PEZI|nr:hypothetical protein F5144DRAFT_163365 [Chaetomium globosum]